MLSFGSLFSSREAKASSRRRFAFNVTWQGETRPIEVVAPDLATAQRIAIYARMAEPARERPSPNEGSNDHAGDRDRIPDVVG
jgi:hypothetical protein